MGKKCSVCSQTIRGKYYTDFWGNRYCAKHKRRYDRCPYCEILIAPGLKDRAVKYSDGRVVCGECDDKAIHNTSEAEPLFFDAGRILNNHKIDVNLSDIDLKIVSRKKLGRNKQGMAKWRERRKNVRVTRLITILILYGLPDFRFRNVAAHELMHAWIYQHTDIGNVKKSERKQGLEGSCEYASYLVISEKEGKYKDLEIERLETSGKAKPYSLGFLKVRKFVDGNGVNAWLKRLEMNKLIF